VNSPALPVLLVGKPWRGGLARYLRAALERCFPGQVQWIATYPESPPARAEYRRDREAWREGLRAQIEHARYRAAIFINLPNVGPLPPRDNHVLWITDDPRVPASEFSPFSRVYVSDPGYELAVADLAGTRFAGVVPFAHDPDVHHGEAERDGRGTCAIANRDAKRDAHFGALFRAGLRPRVIGNYFARHPLFWRYPWCFRPSIKNDAMGAVYGTHALSVNVHAAVVRGGTNMRTFECAGYGIAQVVESRPGLDQLFEPGREVATYTEVDEAAELVRRLLKDTASRRRLAERAQQRVRADHTYEQRVRQLLYGL
jgi:spore maturation protein CgeB